MSTAGKWLYRVLVALFAAYYALFHRLRVEGGENLPREGPVIFFANHRSWHDIPLLAVASSRPVRYMAKVELFRYPVLGPAFRVLGAFPVKRGAADRQAIRASLAVLQGGDVLGIFPEGTRHADGSQAEPGVAYLAWKSGAPVVPAAISLEPRLFGRATVRVGAPIHLDGFSARPTSEEWRAAANRLMAAVAGLSRGQAGSRRNAS